MTARKYVLDTSVLVSAKREYYQFDTFPGFWEFISYCYASGAVHSIDWVKEEILQYGDKDDALSNWATSKTLKGFFKPTNQKQIVNEYNMIKGLIEATKEYQAAEKDSFTGGADIWVVACAKATGGIVVSEEKAAGPDTAKVKMPDICRLKEVKVSHCNTFEMLNQLGARFVMDKNTSSS